MNNLANLAQLSFVKKSGGAFTPDYIANIDWWFEAGQQSYNTGTTQATNGQTVATWASLAGAISATEATNKPVFTTGTFGTQPSLLFDGVDDALSATVTARTARTIFLVAKFAVSTVNKRALDMGTNSSIYNNGGGYGFFATQAAGVSAIGGTDTAKNIIALNIASAASMTTHLNTSSVVATIDPNNEITTSTTLYFANENGNNNFANIHIGAVIAYSRSLAAFEMDYVFAGLKSKYSTV